MIKSIERSDLKQIHITSNPEIPYYFFEINYGLREVENGIEFEILENGKRVLFFTNGESYFDKRKPNEIQLI